MDHPDQTPVDRALRWLTDARAPSGELPAWASPLDQGEPVWLPDSLKFITALAATSLATVDRPEAAALVDGAVAFLRAEREANDLWRYWSQQSEQYAFTPPDADDTACASMAVELRGDRTDANVALLLANRDPDGRFRTWFVPHPDVRGWRWRRAMRAERTAEVRALRQQLWDTTEADADDVDVVVNANVCRYLGGRAPDDAARWVADTLRGGTEVGADKWHRNRTTYWSSVAAGARRGVRAFAELDGLIVDRVRTTWRQGALVEPLDRAQALLALQALDAVDPVRSELADALVATQLDDGSWARSIFYFGGPKELFGWASEALATSYAAAALHAEGRG